MLELEDIFLNNKSMQLKIEYNPVISSYKPTVSESRTETLGSQYPYIKRNGALNYKTFPISGLITSFCDEEGLFINKDIIYGDYKDDYANYNTQNNINEYYDVIYEKRFRDKVIEFLFDNSAKLFRSNTEGNIIIKLMDISFTPKEELGRMLYTFSATAYEIDECSIDNYNKYDISTVGTYSTYVNYLYTKVGQINGTFSGRGENIYTAIEEQINNNQTVTDYATEVNYLTWVRLSFESDPYLIEAGADGSLTPATDSSTNTILGYIVYINGQATYVNSDGVYELAGDGVKVTSIWFPVETKVMVDYVAKIEEYEAETDVVTQLSYYVKAGQIQDIFNCGDSVIDIINEKYAADDGVTFQKIISIDKVSIEADPGTVIYIKDSFDDDYFRHVVGETGVLTFYDEEAVISDFYFKGIHLSDLSDYEVNDGKISYNGKQYTLNENNDVECPVEALIDYIYELEKGEY
jgi:hypothetical protein